MKVSEALRGATRIGVDTSALIDQVYANSRSVAAWEAIFSRKLPLVGSVVLIVELLATQDAGEVNTTQIKETLSHVELINLDAEIASLAASIRRDYGLETPDAIHIATAIVSRCEAFLTADRDYLRVSGYPLPWAPNSTLKIIITQELTA